MANTNLILGIETSCDETAVAIVCRDSQAKPTILSNIVLSQIDEHAAFGGVVPELAARAHLNSLDYLIENAMKDAGVGFDDLNAIAVTGGPGLVGGLIVGLMSAKGLAAARGLPLICVNHLEGHALTARLTHNLAYPYLLLLVSGGHTQILSIDGLGQYQRWASTIDDALGEAFDKTAKLLSLGFPGGPAVEKAALNGNAKRFDFPQPLRGKDTLNMSFSGLKTAVRVAAKELAPLSEQDVADICASFQSAVGHVLVNRLGRAIERFENENADIRNLVVAGGVAANLYLRSEIEKLCHERDWQLIAPPLELCGDNGAMIAWAGLERFEAGYTSAMNFTPRSRWPLDEVSTTLVGGGRRGAKA
ncbi:MAG: tRNA (adenosine(37)-N6)-threonylcarbamoyltransferase complex transferase subunit TsaD [Rhizobiaceae bacterium]|nr:tRNA (adenosine(37)-N6)-threonylcarbamoyltransferase complex transferase subunit TsaD [Rhizobiaceae bacterium]